MCWDNGSPGITPPAFAPGGTLLQPPTLDTTLPLQRDIMRCHEMLADTTALADARLRPLTLYPAPPLLAAVRSGPPITLWPSAYGSTFDASLPCFPSSTRASEALGPAHHAIPGRTSHHSTIALASPDCIRHPCTPPCVGALLVCYAISAS